MQNGGSHALIYHLGICCKYHGAAGLNQFFYGPGDIPFCICPFDNYRGNTPLKGLLQILPPQLMAVIPAGISMVSA